ncbi:hypothetical protein LCGC14_1097370 [marine sediment metagenome]|uniref:Uncharacterized protein n=1 Tax=marine sediment metagenome TaxID=412755 RepID=A0A0F9MEZ4_9ZZZZ
MSRKDTYRQKVYNAESRWIRNWGDHGVVDDLNHAKKILDHLALHFEVVLVRIEQNRRLQNWSGWYRSRYNLIEVRNSKPEVKTVLHEFAHHLDAKRNDYDGKGHGGSYTQAMLDVIEFHFDTESMVRLMRCYEDVGAIIGAFESRKVADRTEAGTDRRQQRHGLIEEAWVVKVSHPEYGTNWLLQDKLGLAKQVTSAGVWKRQATAEKALIARGGDWSTEVVKVEAELDTLFTNRWWALREAE